LAKILGEPPGAEVYWICGVNVVALLVLITPRIQTVICSLPEVDAGVTCNAETVVPYTVVEAPVDGVGAPVLLVASAMY
jgi:hypothetical protein